MRRRRTRRILAVLVLAAMGGSCSGGDGSPFDTTAGPPTTGEATTTTSPADTSTVPPDTTTTTSPEESIGLIESVFPEEGALVVSVELGIVPVDLILVAMEEGRPPADADAVAAAVGGTVVGRLEAVDFYQIRFPGSTEADLQAALEAARVQPGVMLAVPEGALFDKGDTCESRSVLAESSYTEGTNARPLEMIGVEEAWAILRASGVQTRGATLGVVDRKLSTFSSEIGGAHPIEALAEADTTADPLLDANGDLRSGGLTHGTQVAQVAGANPDDGGISGVGAVPGGGVTVRVASYRGSAFTPMAVAEGDRELLELYQQDGQGFTYNSMAKILEQIRNGATVINMSYGSDTPAANEAQRAAYYRLFFERMYAKYPKVVFVAAAGNEGDANVGLDGSNYAPGGLPVPNLITVGGLNKQGGPVPWSNFEAAGGEVTIAAPARDIPVGVGQDGRTVTSSGTSFATPMVAAAAALMKSINPELTAEQVKQILVETAYPGAPAAEGSDTSTLVPENVGGGILRVDEAVLRVINDLRRDADPPQDPLDKETLLGLARLHGAISPSGGLDYNVAATVDEVREDGSTGLSIELLGEGLIQGDSVQSMPTAGAATWTVSALEGSPLPSVRICRTDAAACCDLTVDMEVAGTWTGTLTLTEILVPEGTTLPDGTPIEPGWHSFDEVLACSEELGEEIEQGMAEAIEQMKQGFPITLTFTGTLQEPGTVTLSANDESVPGVPWRVEGGSIVFELADEESYVAFSLTPAGNTMSGAFGSIQHDEEGDVEMRGTVSLARAGE